MRNARDMLTPPVCCAQTTQIMKKRASRNHDNDNSLGLEAPTSQDIETIRLALAEDNVFFATVNSKRKESLPTLQIGRNY